MILIWDRAIIIYYYYHYNYVWYLIILLLVSESPGSLMVIPLTEKREIVGSNSGMYKF